MLSRMAVLGALILVAPLCAADPTPKFFGAKPGSLAKAKERIAGGDKDLAKALKTLLSDADKALLKTPPTVTERSKPSPNGDKHDYMSLAPYFWPDPAKKDGLPYLRHDGKTNPESRDPKLNDNQRVTLMANSVETLALAYYFTGKESYAEHAAKFVRVWFLDSATRMNPHLKYAQAVLGKNDGRGAGILEGRHLAAAADAIGLLVKSKAWKSVDQKALNAWFDAYLDWLLTSESGKQEQAAKNNHGSHYDVQAARLALCLGRDDAARAMIEAAKQRRVAAQFEPDGTQPQELKRTASFSYSCFNLEALADLANLGEHVGVDLWRFATLDGRSMRRGIEYMLPYLDKPAKKWPYEQIKDDGGTKFLPVVLQASLAYENAAEFRQVLAKYPETRTKRFNLLYAR